MNQLGVVEVEGVALESGIGRLIPAVGACLKHAGRPLPNAVLAGLFGHAFESSYAVGGVELWAHGELEWSHFGHGLKRLGMLREGVELIGNRPDAGPIPTAAEWSEAHRRAFDLTAQSVRRGAPTLVWSPMSLAQRDEGVGAFNWGVFVGVDQLQNEYLALHDAPGRYRVPYDQIGRCDPVNWLSVTAFLGPDPQSDPLDDVRSALKDAALVLSGERTSALQPASEHVLRHGPAAFDAFADDVEASVKSTGWRAGYWARARDAAAAFCEWATAVPLGEVGDLFRLQAQELRGVTGDQENATKHARRAAQLQREVLDAMAGA